MKTVITLVFSKRLTISNQSLQTGNATAIVGISGCLHTSCIIIILNLA